jgi:hypothetical protein
MLISYIWWNDVGVLLMVVIELPLDVTLWRQIYYCATMSFVVSDIGFVMCSMFSVVRFIIMLMIMSFGWYVCVCMEWAYMCIEPCIWKSNNKAIIQGTWNNACMVGNDSARNANFINYLRRMCIVWPISKLIDILPSVWMFMYVI